MIELSEPASVLRSCRIRALLPVVDVPANPVAPPPYQGPPVEKLEDGFYSIAGAGVGMATLIFVFCDIGLNSMAISILLASTLGLALAQSVSRTI